MTGNDPLLGAAWPIDRLYLVGLIEMGFSDARIAASFSVDDQVVRVLRESYSLDPADGILQAQTGTSAASALDEMSNGVQAAVTYLSAAIKSAKRDANSNTTAILLMEKSLVQLLRVGRAYQTLQNRLPPATE